MVGRRFRHILWPNFNLGGIIQFEDGYWPPTEDPPCADPGLCSFVEKAPLFGTYLVECGQEDSSTQETVIRDNATMIAKAEEALARMMVRGLPPADEASAPPAPEAVDESRLPSPGEVKRMNKTELAVLGERLGIADEDFNSGTRPDQIKAVLGEIQAIEE